MSQELYLMRHAETLFNQLHRIQGFSDSPLTEKGIKEAQQVGESLSQSGITFDHAYASTQERACDTLELVSSLSYERVKGLKEWNFGVFEGESEALNPPRDPKKHSYGEFFVQFGGESDRQVQKRMVQTLTEIMERPHHQKVLVVSHAGAIFMFLRKWIDWDQMNRKFNFQGFKNCSILKFKFENHRFEFQDMINPLQKK